MSKIDLKDIEDSILNKYKGMKTADVMFSLSSMLGEVMLSSENYGLINLVLEDLIGYGDENGYCLHCKLLRDAEAFFNSKETSLDDKTDTINQILKFYDDNNRSSQ